MSNADLNKIDDSKVEITGTIDAEQFGAHIERAVLNLAQSMNMPGFRKGKVPPEVVRERVGTHTILERAAQSAIEEHYPRVIAESNIDAIGKPEIVVTKLAEGNPLEYKATQHTLPQITLPDYRAIAKRVLARGREPVAVTDQDIDNVIEEARKQREAAAHAKQNTGEGANSESSKIEVNDEFARSLGDFKDLADLREKLRAEVKKDKELKEKDKIRMEILEAIGKEVDIALPAVLVEREQEKMLAELRFHVERSGLDFKAYLEHIKKTEDDLRSAWKETAEKRVKINLILNEVAKAEQLRPSSEEIERETEQVLAHAPDADRDRARTYAESLLTYEKVYQLLENPS